MTTRSIVRAAAKGAHRRLVIVRWVGARLLSLALLLPLSQKWTVRMSVAVWWLWGNHRWSASRELVRSVAAELAVGPRRMLECGSGLTTLLAFRIAQRTGGSVLTLEHDGGWLRSLSLALPRPDDEVARVVFAPLARSSTDVEWYDAEEALAGRRFDLVLVDGPPSETTAGARSGVLDVLDRVEPTAAVIVDDCDRTPERALVQAIAESVVATQVDVLGPEGRRHAVLRTGERRVR